MAIRGNEARSLDSEALRRLAFLYQDGIVLAATLRAFAALGLLDRAEDAPVIADRCRDLPPCGFAHLRVGIRTLAQAGWIEDGPTLSPASTCLRWTASGREVLSASGTYVSLGHYLARFADPGMDAWSKHWTGEQHADFASLSARAERQWNYRGDPDSVVPLHLEGALLTPLLLGLQQRGRLAAGSPFLADGALGNTQARLLRALGWLSVGGQWTSDGLRRLSIVPYLGLTASYLPMLARLPDLYRGSLAKEPGRAGTAREWHVQRELNIHASAAAHGRYFADADALIRPIFEAEPLGAQPGFVLDVGCGDGSWLARVARLVRSGTLRGRNLDRFPLRIVGVDYALAAAEQARGSLADAGIEALVIVGDVGDPEWLQGELALHGMDMTDALHLHGFVDHDRGFRGAPAGGQAPSSGSGAYIGPDGTALTPAAVEADLTAHLARWTPYIRRHGLIALEAHCVPPKVTARHQGALHSIAFDACHGYSRQYPVEHGAYVEALRRAGPRPAATRGRRYPTNRPFVAVSLNHLMGPGGRLFPASTASGRRDSWFPEPDTDLADGLALHRLIYVDGEIRQPRPWCAPATNALITRAMFLLEERLEGLAKGGAIRVCDYGTGTGLAAIELLKACRERGFDTKLVAREASLELLCLDIPSAWFAQGRRLLEGCSWSEFHALTDAEGRFRRLAEVTQGRQVDLVLCSMVFHLIRPPALARLAAELAGIMAPAAALLWNAPDIGPAAPWSMLFHDANRALRAHWEAMLEGTVEPDTPDQREAVARAPRDEQGRPRIDRARAGRRILPRPNQAHEVASALSPHLTGGIETRTYEMTAEEVAQVLRVPSNHRELLPEIEAIELRRCVVDQLMAGVLSTLCRSSAATGLGVAVHWTSGEHRPPGRNLQIPGL